MIITQILQFLAGKVQSIIALAAVPLRVFALQPEEEGGGRQAAEQEQGQRDGEAGGIQRGFAGDEDVAGDDAAAVADADLHGGADAAFVVAAQVVAEPDQGDGLGDAGSREDEVEGEVFDVFGDVVLAEEDAVSGCGDEHSEHDEGEAVADTVGELGGDEGDRACNGVYGD